jgi:hypothetical protein
MAQSSEEAVNVLEPGISQDIALPEKTGPVWKLADAALKIARMKHER